MKCHLCEESTCCPVHDPEEYAIVAAFQAAQHADPLRCGWCGQLAPEVAIPVGDRWLCLNCWALIEQAKSLFRDDGE